MRVLHRRMLLRSAVCLSASTAALALLDSCGQVLSPPPAKVPRIGYLSPGPRESVAELVDAFLAGLRDLGYVEGQTIAIEWRFTTAGNAQFSELAAELVRLPVDVIVASFSQPAAMAAKQATSTIPIVAIVAWPVETGLVASLARPGGNLTGWNSVPHGIFGKRLDLLRNVMPGLVRVGALVNATSPSNDVSWNEIRAAAEQAGVRAQRIELRSANDIEAAFEAAAVGRVDALLDAQSPLLFSRRARVAELALQYRLACLFNGPYYVAAGLLMYYGANPAVAHRRGAGYVDKILRGTKPADLPVEQPTVFEFVVNLKTAQALGLTIPSEVAAQVTEWIQ